MSAVTVDNSSLVLGSCYIVCLFSTKKWIKKTLTLTALSDEIAETVLEEKSFKLVKIFLIVLL